jgi:type IV pilus assembly protein PilB
VKEAENKIQADPPIIKIVDTLIKYAYENKSSDIHLDPLDEKAIIRFRVDGILHDIVSIPLQIHTQVVTRIKVLSRLRTDEHQAAQDGKLRYKLDSGELDIRVSIVPITEGEKVVMRLLSDQNRQFSLHDLGFSDSDLDKVKNAFTKPYGMILATGPTGSGKTTTLYSILKLLNERKINIMTIEDPVEYDMQGVNQIQVNKETNLTFAEGLRSIVRQDPDVILVGEIRDPETASIAINSAMTGHLVLSTLHTNDSATTFPRLLDMKVEPFLISSTVTIVVAQRLVRQICTKCRTGKDIPVGAETKDLPSELLNKYFKSKKSIRVYYGKGCSVCHKTGYRGRIGIFETLLMSPEIKKAVVERKTSDEIHAIALKEGMTSMLEDGMSKISQGLQQLKKYCALPKNK